MRLSAATVWRGCEVTGCLEVRGRLAFPVGFQIPAIFPRHATSGSISLRPITSQPHSLDASVLCCGRVFKSRACCHCSRCSSSQRRSLLRFNTPRVLQTDGYRGGQQFPRQAQANGLCVPISRIRISCSEDGGRLLGAGNHLHKL